MSILQSLSGVGGRKASKVPTRFHRRGSLGGSLGSACGHVTVIDSPVDAFSVNYRLDERRWCSSCVDRRDRRGSRGDQSCALYQAGSYRSCEGAKAAADQVELQRPRPIVLATFSYSFKQNQNAADDRFHEFCLENIGGSPAFDVEVSSIEVPDASNRLITESLSHLAAGSTHSCKHSLENGQGVLGVLAPAKTFANDLVLFFDREKGGTLTERIDKRHQIHFTLSYRALDRSRFKQQYAFIVFFPRLRAWIEPVGSLLENSTRESEYLQGTA